MRYNLDNAITLCIACHLFWAHRAGMEFAEWIIGKLPPETMAALQNARGRVEKQGVGWYEDRLAELRGEARALGRH
jgi:hypothetical protein